MKKSSVSRRDFLAASGASLAMGLSAAKAAGKPSSEAGDPGGPRDKDPRGLPRFYPTAHFDKDDWQRKILE